MSTSTFDFTPELPAPATSCPDGISTWGSDRLLQMKSLHFPALYPLLGFPVSVSRLSKWHHQSPSYASKKHWEPLLTSPFP